MWLFPQERAETLKCDAYISLEAGKPGCPGLHPTACKRSNCKLHAFAFTGVFATTTRHLVTAKEMTLSPPNSPVSHQYCPVDSDEPPGLPFLCYELFTSPFPLLLTLQWVKVNSWVIIGTISWSKELWHLSGRGRRFPIWQHLPQSLDAAWTLLGGTFLASGRGDQQRAHLRAGLGSWWDGDSS